MRVACRTHHHERHTFAAVTVAAWQEGEARFLLLIARHRPTEWRPERGLTVKEAKLVGIPNFLSWIPRHDQHERGHVNADCIFISTHCFTVHFPEKQTIPFLEAVLLALQ